MDRTLLIRQSLTCKMVLKGVDLPYLFAGAVFIGYHARWGTPQGVVAHTFSGDVMEVRINGVPTGETGLINGVAGYYGVPVVFAAGDRALCDQIKTFLDDVETVAVKEGIGAAANTLHPDRSHQLIRAGVTRALRDLGRFEPFAMDQPYTLALRLKNEESVYNGSFFPGAERTGDWELTYTSDDFLNIMYAYSVMRR